MSFLIFTASIGFIIYISFFLLIFIYQDKLIFFPPGPNLLRYRQWKDIEFSITSGEDHLQLWRVTNNQCSNHYTLVYFGGNAEDVSGNLANAGYYNVKDIYFINLSGYGGSTGTPSESSFYKNGLDVYDYIVHQKEVRPDSIILMGRSLGSAVAIYVNAKRSAKALLLITPFDKLSNLVPTILKRLFPTALLLRHKFDNLSYLDEIKNKILILAASHDEVIPASLTMSLHKMCTGNTQCSVIENTNHQTISNEDYFKEINTFIEAL